MTKIDRPKKIPSVNILMNTPSVQKMVSMHGVAAVTRSVQSVLIKVRQSVLAGGSTDMAGLSPISFGGDRACFTPIDPTSL